MAEGDVFDVDEHVVFALLVPYLVAGVAGVDEDRADRELVAAYLTVTRVSDATPQIRNVMPLYAEKLLTCLAFGRRCGRTKVLAKVTIVPAVPTQVAAVACP